MRTGFVSFSTTSSGEVDLCGSNYETEQMRNLNYVCESVFFNVPGIETERASFSLKGTNGRGEGLGG